MAQNCGANPLSAAEAQQLLADVVNVISRRVHPYCWKLTGDDRDSLCNLLDIDSSTMVSILRLCGIFGPSDLRLSMQNFEMMALHFERPNIEWQMYRPVNASTQTPFIRIGNLDLIDVGDEVISLKGSDQYERDGSLSLLPRLNVHRLSMKPREARFKLTVLLAAVNSKDGDKKQESNGKTTSTPTSNGDSSIEPGGRLVEYVRGEIEGVAAKFGVKDYKLTARADRQLKKTVTKMVNDAAVMMLEKAIANLNDGEKAVVSPTKSPTTTSKSPTATTAKSTAIVTPAARRSLNTAINLSDDDELTEEEESSKAFLTGLKEESLLIGLLSKKLNDNDNSASNKRVFTLHTNNGRVLLVVLPPDTQSVDSFVETAKKTNWVDDMLKDKLDNKLHGLLSYLARQQPTAYQEIAGQQRIQLTDRVLDTTQTVALRRLLGLNDQQLQQMRSYLKRMGKVELQHSKKDLLAIDTEVGLDHIPQPVFGSFTYEWASSNNKSKKRTPPEKCNYWTTSLSSQVLAEVDLHIQHLFQLNGDLNTIPTLDYPSPGFGAAGDGIVILFGGDHGDTSCPVSAKINFSSPAERKQMGDIGYQCPIIPIASIDCTKDTYEILNNTVMPVVRQHIINLKDSAIVVVYRMTGAKDCFKAVVVNYYGGLPKGREK